MNPGEVMFRAMPTRPAVYEDSAGRFDLRVHVLESDRAFRTSSRDQLIGSAVSGSILQDARVRRGGRITVGSTVFRVDGVLPSSVPGLSDLKLERLEGDALLVHDARGIIPTDEVVLVNGREIRAHINRSVEVEEPKSDGTRIVVSRTMVAIRIEDAGGIRAGAKVMLPGAEKEKPAARVMADGVGFVKVLV